MAEPVSFECMLCVGCSRWAWKRISYVGARDSELWQLATAEQLEPAPRACRAVLAVSKDDLANPRNLPDGGGYRMDPADVVKRVTYKQIPEGRSPPYLIFVDREHRELVLAVRGLNLVRESDYKVLLDNRSGQQTFDDGFVHHGLFQAATWLLNREGDTLRRLLLELGPDYKLVFAGHSLGSGIAALMTIIVIKHRDQYGGIPRSRIRCYAIAPARCMSLNLAIKYADVINSIILQDDFLPRTPTPLEHIFGSIFCLPCLLQLVCLKDTFIPKTRELDDPRRLYAPGRIYHIVERKFCSRCGRYPPIVRTGIAVDGRFERIVLSCSTTADHALVSIEREAQKALDLLENSKPTGPPTEQKMTRKLSLEQEHKDVLERAVMSSDRPYRREATESIPESQESAASNGGDRPNQDELVEKLHTGNK